MKKKTPRRLSQLRRWAKDKSGSEAVEAVYVCFGLCLLIMSVMLILGYALQANAMSYAAKRATRHIEVTGQVNSSVLERLMGELMENYNEIGGHIEVTPRNPYLTPGSNKIQLREKFTVHVSGFYTVKVATLSTSGNPLELKLPINVYVLGQSEVYWKH